MAGSIFGRKSVIVIFAYAPAGFGHLRVSEALYQGLPEAIAPPLLGAQDESISAIHRFLSLDPAMRGIMEFFQQGGLPETLFTVSYRAFLRWHTNLLYQQVITILEERVEPPEAMVMVATHFGLAHQFAGIKKRIEQEKKIRIVFVVQVTDDSPQPIWYIEGADAIFVPSERTKQDLIAYGKRHNLKPVSFLITPYPVSPRLCVHLESEFYHRRKAQYDPKHEAPIHIVVPLSGAAVHTRFYRLLIKAFDDTTKRIKFHIVAKNAAYTNYFLSQLLPLQSVQLYTSDSDRGVVDLYEKVYSQLIVGFEITKPSEQAFKALLRPSQRGGSILLFSEPVGRQERDNLDFLRRHHLIPRLPERNLLFDISKKENPEVNPDREEALRNEARSWRGIELPKNPQHAVALIQYCLRAGIFHSMLSFMKDSKELELQDNGVEVFWKETESLLEKTLSR